MAWTAPATATSGQVLTAAFWNTHVRDNELALESFCEQIQTAWDAILDDTVASSTEKTWDTSKLQFSNPGRAVNVLGWFQGWATSGAQAVIRCHLEVSFDGVTYTGTGNGDPIDQYAATGAELQALFVARSREGTPTGDVHMKARISRPSGTGTWSCTDGNIYSLISPQTV